MGEGSGLTDPDTIGRKGGLGQRWCILYFRSSRVSPGYGFVPLVTLLEINRSRDIRVGLKGPHGHQHLGMPNVG